MPSESPAEGIEEPAPGAGTVVDRAALAAQALAQAKAAAIARGIRPPAPVTSTISKNPGSSPPTPVGRSGGRARREDPAPLDAAIGGLIADVGWELAVATGSVFGQWSQIVGPDLAAHTTPERLADGELIVTADSTAWATQLRLLAGELIRRLNAELGDGTVQRVQVRGPGSAGRRPGQWRVKGSRGPRDTYG